MDRETAPSGNGTTWQSHYWFDARLKGLETWLEERDRRYEERFKAQVAAVDAAFSAQKQLTTVVIAASEKAIEKAEAAQAAHNASSNEFRGTLKDQNETMMPRAEADARFAAMGEKIDLLKESQNKRDGGVAQQVGARSQSNWSVGIILLILFSSLSLLLGIVSLAVAILRT